MAELAQLSDRPALVDGIAQSAVEALVIPSPKLRDLMVEEADLGERIMRGEGGGLEAIRWRQRASDGETRRPIRHVFLFIGADPN